MRTIRVLAVLPWLAACAAPEPPFVPDDDLLGGFEGTVGEFTIETGVRGSREEIEALVGQPRASMRAYSVSSMTEEAEVLRGLGLSQDGPFALVRDAAGRHYNVVGTPEGTFLFDVSSFVTD